MLTVQMPKVLLRKPKLQRIFKNLWRFNTYILSFFKNNIYSLLSILQKWFFLLLLYSWDLFW
jgi:hypothetical protein